jgi:2',3'-cyclic-nucleotide 2'-phosphodiesterase / 3'-nucleotidase / 5'-nucleotidase
MTNQTQAQNFTLQLLHASDQEAAVPALDDAPRFSAVLNALKNQDANNDGQVDYANTILLSSGDAYIPSLFLDAAADPSLAPLLGKEGQGRADIVIQNELGFQAIAFGNHEFDLGTGLVKSLLSPDGAYRGANFPYLSSNLNFAPDTNLAPLVTTDGQEASTIAGKIAKSTVITVNGEKIGVVGATTPTLRSISSPGSVGVLPSNPTDIVALAAEIQKSVDALKGQGINKIVLLAHMQQIAIEQQLAGLLKDVDIIMAGGSNTRLLDSTDRLRAGDVKQGDYPILTKSATGEDMVIINTDGNYKYVGRLVVDFDAQGRIIPTSINPNISGAYATDDQGVAALNAQGLVDPEIKAITDALRQVIIKQDSNFFGITTQFLNGTRNDVRTQETNLGNLTADANLFYAKRLDPTVTVSIKNGGGIRNNIGRIFTPTGATEAVKLPPEGNPLSGKPEGGISQPDLQNSLSFNNKLTLVTLTAEQLKQVLEHGVAASTATATPGQFPQIGGISFSFDITKPAGQRIQNAAILNEDGTLKDALIKDGQIVGNKDRGIRVVTLDFLASGGDSYPFASFITANPTFANRVDLAGETTTDLNGNGKIDAPVDPAKFDPGQASFSGSGGEQDAFAEYLKVNFATQPFSTPDVGADLDTRIQRLNARQDGVFAATSIEQATTSGVINLKGGAGVNQLRFTVNRNNPNAAVNELVVFETDGSNNINLKQLLESGKARVISSVVSNRPNGFTGETPRTLGFAPGAKLGFALIKNGTADQVRAGANKEIIFSTANNFVSNVTGNAFDLAVEGLNVKVEAVNDSRALGTGLQTGAEGELIDLRELTGKVEANFSVYREAAFNNQIYFYKVDNADGFLGGLNPDTANTPDYLNAALSNLVKGADGRAVKLEVANQGSFNIKATVDAGSIIAPLMVVNGTLEQLQDNNPSNNPAVFFPFIGASTGKFDQIRLLGDNSFGFEDIVGGGDADYNDVIVKVNLTPVV